jgi:hypothetical protein
MWFGGKVWEVRSMTVLQLSQGFFAVSTFTLRYSLSDEIGVRHCSKQESDRVFFGYAHQFNPETFRK